jgi:hypothetical protein
MYIEIEYPKCETTQKTCDNIFILRGYTDKNKSKYFASTTVILRKDDLWEPTAWITTGKAPKGYQIDAIQYLINSGYRVSGTFETVKLKAYKRYFKKAFDLKTVREKIKLYNGIQIDFTYVEFIQITRN